jgi:hypothetical protein
MVKSFNRWREFGFRTVADFMIQDSARLSGTLKVDFGLAD